MVIHLQRRQEEEDSGGTHMGFRFHELGGLTHDIRSDEDVISMRTLAMSRYRRNHELMEEALYHAAFGPWLPPLFASLGGASLMCL